ncbi:MAG: MraY family glycosyltransferase [Rikenellaceae bacterium]
MLVSLKNRILDKIDSRKVHSTSASRLGGASFLPAIVLTTIVSTIALGMFNVEGVDATLSNQSLLVICSMIVLYFVGIYDDIEGMRYKEKFFYQFITAGLVVYSGICIVDFNGLCGVGAIPTIIGMVFTIVLIVFITNAINLIDGIDGLASMLSIMAFGMYALMFFLSGDYVNCIFCIAALGALGPFWHHNVLGIRKRMTSKIFMGDGGTLVIGFLLSVMAVKLWGSHSLEGERFGYISDYSWVVAFTMLIIPCFDVVRVVLSRVKEHKPLFLPDKSHFHHKLLALGLTARQSLMTLVSVNIIFLAVNWVLATQHVNITIIVFFDIVLWMTIHIILTNKLKKNKWIRLGYPMLFIFCCGTFIHQNMTLIVTAKCVWGL